MKTVLIAIGLVLGASCLAHAQLSGKVGYIDLQRVIRESQAGKAAKAAFEREFQEKRSIIEQKK
ncbi:MAG TPA: OmpH family outer membrane protein, partial [Thermodesulfobacteriota bacterium]|nr:OmpH family outer membrane protein [Thermodesulfobacteriota bacterium]